MENRETINKIFKAYDIRGKYPEELNETIAYRIGQAVSDYFFPTQILVGRDHRDSSYPLFQAISGGIMNQGVDIVDIGVCTSPMFYFAVAKGNYETGVMITASHNPYIYNGVKIVKKMAVPLGIGLGLENINDLVTEGNFHKSQKQGTVKSIDLTDEYVNYLKTFQSVALDKNLKIVLDPSNGPAGKLAYKVFGDEINSININFEPTDDKNKDPNPLKPETRKQAEEIVINQKTDGAFLWDGDGDRFFVLDEKARLIPGNFVTAVLAEYILKKHPNEKVICDLRLSRAVFKIIERSGGLPIMNRVGHSYIKDRMRKENAIFGAEMSGHYYFRGQSSQGLHEFYSDNGIIPALYLLEIMSQKTKKLSELFDPFFEKYFISEELNFKVRDSQQTLKLIENEFSGTNKEGEQAEIIKLDGLTIQFKDWWFNIRPSNTEPVMRVIIETSTKESLKDRIDLLTRMLSVNTR
ncbi:MAG: Phosphomannomutase [Parcubacteria group bacterium GW2011_GWD2_38_12]|nr:MAG: Phosphomannomutase [Parcubacteria group bacterium GW2011_GWC2_36_17]KKQ38739.1 MAG: Phosphomannomutase [Candidatus Moranbacteria bacterium GW2011_GWF2_37_7]KKQ42756.1 MAG: Phosphomannomutase [Parcubacteria group bacterium GW2011_GWE2_37_8]KKQ52936.1 MAG: Phosphomannomutase [Parcubacteria group bacterium GW2011_GWD2_38_12]KKQ59141.1 MAG: Phosphomannomutase [Parcubacteria group bacterium GW2011_GWC1_38_17]KKQ59754.1 MAG: Phosphomannomutase [Parcubacteria group bacterium GW2011_GWD1_38_16